MICSPYRLTFFGEVLLNFGDECDSLPLFGAAGEVQVVSFAGAAAGAVFGRGNRVESLSWSRLRNWASHVEAQSVAMAGLGDVEVGTTGTLTIEVENGASFELAGFALESAERQVVAHAKYEVRESYSGQGAGLTVTDGTGLPM